MKRIAALLLGAMFASLSPRRRPQLPPAPVVAAAPPGPLLAGVDTGTVRADLTPDGEAYVFGMMRAYPPRSFPWAWSLCGAGARAVEDLESGRAAA